jgi:hypothetical protein
MTTNPTTSGDELPYVYVLVREDLEIEQQIVQACHAAHESGLACEAPADVSRMIVCTVPDQTALLIAAERLREQDVGHELFFEPDFGIGYSALATHPLSGRERRPLRRYPLYSMGHNASIGAKMQH